MTIIQTFVYKWARYTDEVMVMAVLNTVYKSTMRVRIEQFWTMRKS